MDALAALVHEVSDRFTLGAVGRSLVQELLRVIGSPTTGGVSGAFALFERAGLGQLATAWLGNPNAPALTVPQLRAALGRDTVGQIARFSNLDVDRAAPAIAVALPRLFGILSPTGKLPPTLPENAQALLAGQSPQGAGGAVNGPSAQMLALPFLALLAVGFLVWLFAQYPGKIFGTDHHAAIDDHARTAHTTTPVAPVELMPARLSISTVNGTVEYAGRIKDEATRNGIIEALKSAFGESSLKGIISTDSTTGVAKWLAGLKAALPELKLPGLQAVFEGSTIRVGGLPSEDMRNQVLAKLKAIFDGQFTVAPLGDRFADAAKSATDRTLAALGGLKPGFAAETLVRVLNLSVINFATGSAEIPADSRSLLEQAAVALKMAPAGTRLEIAGHTDNIGDVATNLPLSQGRADAVRKTLLGLGVLPAMLETKGYGSSQPVAPNDTEDGRFQNRRIEFILIRQPS